jgi:hypothetical protein
MSQGESRMRTVLAAAFILLLTGSAYSQSSSGRPALGIPLGDDKKAPPDPQSEEHEKDYKSAIEKIPPKRKADDPWQGIRSSTTPQTQKSGR